MNEKLGTQNAGKPLRLLKKWRPFLFTAFCLGLLGWAIHATKKGFDLESRIRDLQTAISYLEQNLSTLRAKNAYLGRKSLELERAVEQKDKESRALRLQNRALQLEVNYTGQKLDAFKRKIRELYELSNLRRELLLQPSLRGIIVRINSVYQYAMINLGTEQKVEEGKELFVLQSGMIRGTLKVEETFETFSLCSMRPANSADPFQPGDLVLA